MAKAPGVILERSGGQVRLRGLKWALPVSISAEGKKTIRVEIPPNRWTKVPDEVYEFLRNKFDSERPGTMVPDVEANEDRPHRMGEQPIMMEEQQDPGFYLEFRK